MERNSTVIVPINKIAYRYLLQIYIIIYFLQKNPQLFLFFFVFIASLAFLSDLALRNSNFEQSYRYRFRYRCCSQHQISSPAYRIFLPSTVQSIICMSLMKL